MIMKQIILVSTVKNKKKKKVEESLDDMFLLEASDMTKGFAINARQRRVRNSKLLHEHLRTNKICYNFFLLIWVKSIE